MQTVLLWFFSHKWPLHVSDIYMSIFRSSYIYVVSLPHVVLCHRCWGCGPAELVCSLVHCLSVSIQLRKNHSKIVCIKLVHLPYLCIWCTVTLTSNLFGVFNLFGEEICCPLLGFEPPDRLALSLSLYRLTSASESRPSMIPGPSSQLLYPSSTKTPPWPLC